MHEDTSCEVIHREEYMNHVVAFHPAFTGMWGLVVRSC